MTTSIRTKTKAIHYNGLELKLNEMAKVYKNQPIVSPVQIGPNLYRFSNKKFATKEMLPISCANNLYVKSSKQKRKKSTKFRTNIQIKSQQPLIKIIQSKYYKELYQKYILIKKINKKDKKILQKDVKQLDQKLKTQEGKYQDLISKMVRLQSQIEQLNEQYYEIRRKNLDLNCELDVLRGNQYEDEQSSLGYEQQESFNIDIDQMDYEQIMLLQERMGTANVGLSTQNISKLVQKPLKQFKMERQISFLNPEEDEQVGCCICCQDIQEEEIVTKLSCNHIHHFQCLSKWLKLKRFCPLCKAQISVKK